MKLSISRRAMVAGGAALALGPGLLRSARAENGVTDTTIRIGQSAVFSGPAKDFGVDYRAGIKLYFDRVNKSGGINGRKIELVTYDDAYDPAKTAVNTAKLIDEDKVFALTGFVATGNLAAAMPLAEKAGVPMFAPLVGTTSFRTKVNRYLFHVRAGYDLELRKIISHLSTIGISSIAVVFQDSPFGKSNLATCEQLAAEYKVQVVKTLPLAITAEDAKQVATEISAAKPGAVVMIMAGRMVETFIRDYRAGGVGAPLYTLSVGITDAAGSAKRLDGKLAGLVTASIVPPPQAQRVPIVADYQRDRAEFGEKIDSYTTLEGYIVARVMVEGLRRAGKTLTRDSFIAGLESIGSTRFGDFPIDYSAKNHNGSTFVDLEMYTRDGQLRR
ncbi:ABC-type branched-subunit amino acid transport system substrate-binding protein [Variovorax boronicumulans]|uniref:ABC-type branched-subunit amino acid transport system substrate-binding protein n=2 Tax=Variovorax TaxID=34072 RepID=A0AAW8D4Z4_9BURK|nr:MULTISPECIES: ABC transporter substrate-binding protein [Variovorax]MDP9897487.1 ABC-type branched-subunit amino acid transport system substrate-binding protein [Variovorax boronicumulans]MDP9995817.1 ABC-type branched-subunit amino acid transport system substrate-binding protein [Variovorax boronicumulans]MDQ0006979.1 ABC-type branched-subunit amino acid transport system substrate-binding protein [Variovorax boronicumulans]MDQ0042792.1 ABC-type branched-subunit amino acid transport system s